MALSKQRQQELEYLTPLVEDILKTDITEHISHTMLTMKLKRGQGKRTCGTVKGAMGSWYGSEPRMVINYSAYKDDVTEEQVKNLSVQYSGRWELYLHARKYGLSNDMAHSFAMFYSLSTFKDIAA